MEIPRIYLPPGSFASSPPHATRLRTQTQSHRTHNWDTHEPSCTIRSLFGVIWSSGSYRGSFFLSAAGEAFLSLSSINTRRDQSQSSMVAVLFFGLCQRYPTPCPRFLYRHDVTQAMLMEQHGAHEYRGSQRSCKPHNGVQELKS